MVFDPAADLTAGQPAGDEGVGGPASAGGRRHRTRRVLRSGKMTAGLAIIAAFVLVAVIGPYVAPYNPSALGPDILHGPSAAHLLGTTQSGQDILSQLLVGTRTSMIIGFVAAVAATALSILVGVTAGYVRGIGDDLLSVLTNAVLVIPALPLVIVLAGYLPHKGSLSVAIVISITGWAWGGRVLRAQTLSVRGRDYVEAARATGERTWRIIAVEVLPNQVAIVASGFLFTFIFAILTQASLAFLGLTDTSQWSWGTVLYWAQNDSALNLGAWWWFVPAGVCIALLGMGLTLVNFGIDEFVNPRLRTASGARRPTGRGVSLADRRRRDERPPRPVRQPPPRDADTVLEVRGLSVAYGDGLDAVRAVTDAGLVLHKGELLGLVGESGSGKSTLAYALTRLLHLPGRITAGEVRYHRGAGSEPVNVLDLTRDELRALRWQEVSMVFQSAMNALNPVLDVGAQLTDVLRVHRPQLSRSERADRAAEMLRMVGISPDRMRSYPHQLSGGMRQRVMIAMALLLDPEIIVMDEPTTALDVVMQRGILEEIDRLRCRLGFSVVFITHDLSLLTEIADTIAVMYAGRIVEVGPARDLYLHPLHPYSEGLLRSFPALRGARRELTGIAGSPPDLSAVPAGCAFHPRCRYAFDPCATRVPPLTPQASDAQRQVACWLHDPSVRRCAGDPPGAAREAIR